MKTLFFAWVFFGLGLFLGRVYTDTCFPWCKDISRALSEGWRFWVVGTVLLAAVQLGTLVAKHI